MAIGKNQRNTHKRESFAEIYFLRDDYLINRTDNKPDIKVLVADIYIAGEADILEISSNLHDIDCIVLIGFYNRYSNEAKKLAKSMNVGLFNYREFFGAIHYSGNAFIDYTQKER